MKRETPRSTVYTNTQSIQNNTPHKVIYFPLQCNALKVQSLLKKKKKL